MGHQKSYKSPLNSVHCIKGCTAAALHNIKCTFLVSYFAAVQLFPSLSPQSTSFVLASQTVARPDSRCDSWKVALFDLQGHYRQIWRHWFGVKRACHYSVVWQNSLPKGTVITSLSSFQLTPGKGIIGNHPCNAVPLSFWQLSETTALWFCRLDVKSELYTPSVPQTQHAVSYVGFSHRNLFHWLYIKYSASSAEDAPKYTKWKPETFIDLTQNMFLKQTIRSSKKLTSSSTSSPSLCWRCPVCMSGLLSLCLHLISIP